MQRRHSRGFAVSLFLTFVLAVAGVWVPALAQLGNSAGGIVPTLVNFSGTLTEANGKPLISTVGVTFCLYKEQQGGTPLWLETQNVQPDKYGHYTVALGSTKSTGLPTDLFVSGEARWLGVQPQGQQEQPRVLLLSVPYALKAGDAQTVGGLPPSAFILAAPPSSTSVDSPSSSPSGGANPMTLGGSGQANYVPLWTNSTTLGDSVLYQSGSGSKAKLGINTSKPASTLDVKGSSTVRGLFSLPATGTATSSTGYNSQPAEMTASAFNSGTGTAVTQNFQWQAEPVNNDKSNASGTLNLLFATGSNKLAETGLNIASNGQITFANGQTYPGTITDVIAGTDLTGGGSSGNVTLNVDTTKVPLLASPNTFTNNNAIDVNSNNPGLAVTNAGAGDGADVTVPSGGGIGVNVSGGTYGLVAYNTSSAAGYFLGGDYGVYASGPLAGVAGAGPTGIYAEATICCGGGGGTFYGYSAPSGSGNSGTSGITATGGNGDPFPDNGVYGYGGSSDSDAQGGTGGAFVGGSGLIDGDGVYGSSGGWAGNFNGDVNITGTLNKGGGSFKIDHPLDPANKYLYHSFVESPDMMNVYNGTVVLDGNGEAVIQMAEWFGVLNHDFRYQLTCIGGFAPVYIAEELANNRFKIGGGRAGVKVSWQVTGIRQDAWANAHRIPVEEEKNARERGFYIHPELYGAPPEKQIEWARHPEMMKRMKEGRQSPPRPAMRPVPPRPATMPAPPPLPTIKPVGQLTTVGRTK